MIRHQKAWVIVIALGVLLIPALVNPTLGDGWFWDTANGIGFAAVVSILYLSLETGRGVGAVQRHERIAWFGFALVVVHAGWFIASDTIVVEYLKLSAPVYMLAGIVATVLLFGLLVSSQPAVRRRLWRNHAGFKNVHWWLAVGMLGLAVYHVAASGFYLSAEWQQALFVVFVVAVPVLARVFAFSGRVNIDVGRLAVFVLLGVLTFTLVRNV